MRLSDKLSFSKLLVMKSVLLCSPFFVRIILSMLLVYALSQRLAPAGYPLKTVIIRRKMVRARRPPRVAPRAFNFPSPQPPYDNSRKELSHFRSPYIRSKPKQYPKWRQAQIWNIGGNSWYRGNVHQSPDWVLQPTENNLLRAQAHFWPI